MRRNLQSSPHTDSQSFQGKVMFDMKHGHLCIALCVFSVLLFSAAVSAQFQAGIQGLVKDSSGAVVPGATVTVISNETSRTYTATTGDMGFYKVPGLPPGSYTVTADKPGFKKAVLQNMIVRAESTMGVILILSPGEISSTVTVEEVLEPVLRTENAELSGTLNSQAIQSLPQVGRDPYELLRLTPGVFGDGSRAGNGNAILLGNLPGSPGGSNTSVFQTENQVQISSNGQRVSDNNYLLDGVSVNSLGYGGAAVVTPNQESVKEVKVTSSAYDAQYGRNSGAQIEVISKNGTNRFHGSGFFKYDQPGLNAFNKYGGPNGAAPQRVQNAFRNFGGSIGGPILKDKLFFFFSYEGLRNNSSGLSTATYIETPQFRQSVIAARPNGITSRVFQMAGIAPRVVQVLTPSCSIFPANTCQVVNGGLDVGSITGSLGEYVNPNPPTDPNGQYTGGGFDGIADLQQVILAAPSRTRGDQFNGRIDYQHGRDSFMASTYVSSLDNVGSDVGADARPIADIAFKPVNTAMTAQWNRTISSTMLNQARMNFTRFSADQVADAASTNFGIPEIDVEFYPFSRIKFGASRSETTPARFAQNTYEFRDTLSKIFGNHAAKFGVEFRREQDNSNLLGGARPVYSFSAFWNLANDTPIFEGINTDPRTGGPGDAQKYFRTKNLAIFAQDDWKVRPNLTLNLGLRWEYFSPLAEKRGQLSNIFFPAPGDLQHASVRVVDQLYDSTFTNFGPRLGFAYSPGMLRDKLVVRGGFGIFYNRIPNNGVANVRGNPPFFARENICCGTSSTWFGTPFANGTIKYDLGSSPSPLSFPINPALVHGINPSTGGICANDACTSDIAVEIYGTEQGLRTPYVYQYSFGIEYALPDRWVAALGYEGSVGHHFARIVNQNFLYANNPSFYAVYLPMDDVNTSFNAMNARLSHQFARGFQTEIRYRWSKSLDTLSYGDSPCACGNQTYPQVLSSERGPSDFDATHYLTWSGTWDLPFLRTRNDWMGKVAGGWSISGILTAHSGFPWTPVTGVSVSTPGGPSLSPTRPVAQIAKPLDDHSNDAFARPGGIFPGGGAAYFDFTRSGPPGIGRNSFRGPRYFSTDLTFSKSFGLAGARYLGEPAKLDLRANLFNAFNQLNLQSFLFDSNATHADRPTFGQADAGLAGRVIELQARISF
jgi:outer membrane receptor protein involved in Fe transport